MAEIEEGQFLEKEKRFVAFKHVFNTLQTSVHTTLASENFETAHQIYLDELINGEIKFVATGNSTNQTVQPARIRQWSSTTGRADNHQNALMGNPVIQDSSNPDNFSGDGTNPNVEQIIVPLFKAAGTQRQAYFAFQPTSDAIGDPLTGIGLFQLVNSETNPTPALDASGETDQTYTWALDQNQLIQNANRRIRNWIAPSKFGKDYEVKIFQSNEDYTAPDYNIPLSTLATGDTSTDPQIHGGYIFDYYQGMMYLAPNPTVNDPEGNQEPFIPGLRHPLWIQGYRYIGPTGSNMTVTSAGTSGTSGTSGGGGGVSTTLTSHGSGHPLVYDVNRYGWYDINTLTATDSEDIIEYLSPDNGIIISASIGDQNLVVRLDSSSYNNITADTTNVIGYQNNDLDVYNGGNLFKFAGETFPDYSSYGLFRTTASAGYHPEWITQSFEFSTPVRLDKAGLCYSNNDNIDVTAETVPDPRIYYYPAGYKIEGSVDNLSFEQILFVSGTRTNTINGIIRGPVGLENDNSFNDGSPYWVNNVDETAVGPKRIYCATGSITDSTRYKYYRLYISGGLTGSNDNRENVMALHHLDLWQNLDFGPTNRKQLNLKFNDIPTGRFSNVDSQPFTNFDLAVSESARRIGYTKVIPSDLVTFSEGNIPGEVTFGSDVGFTGPTEKRNIRGVTSITSSIISASNKLIVGELAALSMSGVGDDIIFNTLTTGDLTVQNEFQVNSNVIVPSDKSIFLTNKKADGTDGTDEFSARIFGNFVDNGGVSDMYLDAYRIYTIADAKMHMRTLHPTLGSIVLEAPTTHLSGSSLRIDNAITASAGMELFGSLLISGSIIPATSNTSLTSSFSLGSSTAAWNDIHVSDGTIHFYNGTEEQATIGLDSNNDIEFRSGSEFRTIRAKSVEFIPTGSTESSVKISDDGQGFIAVMGSPGKHSTILRAEHPVLSGDFQMGSITQKGSGSFAILLDADQIRGDAKFVIESNAAISGLGPRLFSVSESGETRAYNYLKVDKYITTTDITASNNILANSFTGTFIGALSSSAQIASEISGAFNNISNAITTRLTAAEAIVNTTLISGSNQIATEISGAFNILSGSIQSRLSTVELGNTSKTLISGSNQIATEISGAFTVNSASITSRITNIEINQITTSSFNTITASVALKSELSLVQPILDNTGSYAITGSDITFNQVTSSTISVANIDVTNAISASNFHATIFNPAKINTSEITSSFANLGELVNTRTFTTDDYNILFAASTRPALTVRNSGGSNITYFGSPVDNADAFIKFEADRSSTTFAMGIDSSDSTFKIAEGAYLNENSGFPPFSIKNNKVAILQSNDPAYELDVAGDIRSTGTMRVDTIKGQSYPYTSIVLQSNVTTSLSISSSGIITANTFVGDGSGLTNLSGIAAGNVISSSTQIASEISGAFGTTSSSFALRITAVEGSSISLPNNLISSSAQITGSINTSGTIIGSNISGTNTGDQNISNLALTSSISGAFTEVSNSLQGRIGTLETHDHSTFAVKTAISGAFVSPFTAAMISGSSKVELDMLRSVTASYALSANVVLNSATASFVTTATTIDGGTF